MTKRSEERVLVIDDGGIGSLVCCLLSPDPGDVVAWFPGAAAGEMKAPLARRRAAARQAELLGLRAFVDLSEARVEGSWKPAPGAGPEAVVANAKMLMDAAIEALRQGCGRVVWPVHHGDDLGALAAAADEARLVSHVLSLATEVRGGEGDGGRAAGKARGIRVDTPLVDLTDDQIGELALDLDAPVRAAWWCETEGMSPCGRCGSCGRWQRLLAGQGEAAGTPGLVGPGAAEVDGAPPRGRGQRG